MEEPGEERQLPAMRIGHAEREVTVHILQRAMADGRLTFAEMEARMGLAYRATTQADLDAVTADLPADVTPLGGPPLRRLASSHWNLIGDIKQGGWISVPGAVQAVSLIGDVTFDLSSAEIPADGVDITAVSIIGDVTIVVGDGTPVEVSSVSVIGDRTEAVIPPSAGAPPVRIRGLVLLGDLKVYSLSLVPEGRLRSWWAAIRMRTLGGGGS